MFVGSVRLYKRQVLGTAAKEPAATDLRLGGRAGTEILPVLTLLSDSTDAGTQTARGKDSKHRAETVNSDYRTVAETADIFAGLGQTAGF